MRYFIFMFSFLIYMGVTSFPVYGTPSDIYNHWAGTKINTIIEAGIIDGEGLSKFHPNNSLSRQEAAVFLSSYIKWSSPAEEEDVSIIMEDNKDSNRGSDSASLLVFTDIGPDSPAFEAVEFLLSRQMIAGYPDGTFRPENTITREEFSVMLADCLGYEEVDEEAGAYIFTDISDSFALEQIIYLAQKGILNGYGDGTFRPGGIINRGEAASILFSLSGLYLQPFSEILVTFDIPYISQLYPVSAVVGCEGTSLLMGLKSKSYASNVDLRTFLDRMPKHKDNPEKGFAGSPYKADPTKKTRTTILPPKLAEYGRVYGNVEDISGSTPAELQNEILAGNPVVVYVTMWWEKPFYRDYIIEGKNVSYLSNNHAVLLSGYNSIENNYYITDPYNSKNLNEELKYWIDGATFERIYNERKHAVVIR